MNKYSGYILLLLMLNIVSLSAQDKSDYVWPNGTDYTDTLAGTEGSIIDFNHSPPNIYYQAIFPAKALGNGIAAISDSQTGELLFYSNGCVVYDSTHQLMLNGDDLNPGTYRDHYCNDGGSPLLYPNGLGMTILPDPNYSKGYYLIHQPVQIELDTVLWDKMLYSYINMDSNGGRGKVEEKNIEFFNENLTHGQITAIKHHDKKSWWILLQLGYSNEYVRILLDKEGFHTVGYQSIGDSIQGHAAQAMFSPDGKQYAWFNEEIGLHIFDFDRNTGLLSKPRVLDISPNPSVGGLCFSPNSQFVYLFYRNYIYQVDTDMDKLENGYELVDTFIKDPQGGLDNSFLFGMLGPDCRIYITARNTTQYYTVIAYPDKKGPSCDVRQLKFKLLWYKDIAAIPNFPHFRIDEPWPCDPEISLSIPVSMENTALFTLYPNPADDNITILSEYEGLISIYTNLGQRMVDRIKYNKEKLAIDISNFEQGVYILHFKADSGAMNTQKFIKI